MPNRALDRGRNGLYIEDLHYCVRLHIDRPNNHTFELETVRRSNGLIPKTVIAILTPTDKTQEAMTHLKTDSVTSE